MLIQPNNCAGRSRNKLGPLMALPPERPAADNASADAIIGGDTLMGFMQQLPEAEISPLGEAAPGAVLLPLALMAGHVSRIIVSKSGGFGNRGPAQQDTSEFTERNGR